MYSHHRQVLSGLLLASTAFAAPLGLSTKRGFLDSLTTTLSDLQAQLSNLGNTDTTTNPGTDVSTGGIIDSLSNTLSDLTASLESIGNIAPSLDSVGNVAPNIDIGDVANVGDLNLGDLNVDLGDAGSGNGVGEGLNLSDLVNDSAQLSALFEELGLSDSVGLDNIGQGDLTLESLAGDLGVSVQDLLDALEEMGLEDVAGGEDEGEGEQ